MTGRNLLRLSIALLPLTAAVHAQPPQPWLGISRTDLQRHDLSTAGREMVQVRVDFEPGAVAPPHRHPGEEIVYVLEGRLEYRVEGRPAATLGPGDVLFIPDGAMHAATNVGDVRGAELATYIVRKGEPLSTQVP
jgi:quercetin dioxygenase-like cupin family protein